MRKRLFFINGSVGVGKSTTSFAFMKKMPNCAFLEIGWCFRATSIDNNDIRVRTLQCENCCFLINNYLHSPVIENIILVGPIGDQKWIDQILSQLDLRDVDFFNIILTANDKAYQRRLKIDIKRGKRPQFWVGIKKNGQQAREKTEIHYLTYLHTFERLNGIKIDTSNLTVDQVVQKIVQISEQAQLA